MEVTVHRAKTHLSHLLARVERGETIVIARGQRPVARLVPYDDQPIRRVPGAYRGQGSISPDFDAPLPAKLRRALRG
jgi:prevent-host-death family protein